jgi:hypothetical protein
MAGCIFSDAIALAGDTMAMVSPLFKYIGRIYCIEVAMQRQYNICINIANGMSSKSIITQWVEFFNAGDASALSFLYHNTAVKEFATGKRIEGRKDIRETYKQEFSGVKMVCIVDRILVSEDMVTLEWKDLFDLRGCSIFNIVDDVIMHERVYFDELSFLRTHELPLPKI